MMLITTRPCPIFALWPLPKTDPEPYARTTTTLPAGTHAVTRVPNPYGHTKYPWLVLARAADHALIGAAEAQWRLWQADGWVVLREEGPCHGSK